MANLSSPPIYLRGASEFTVDGSSSSQPLCFDAIGGRWLRLRSGILEFLRSNRAGQLSS